MLMLIFDSERQEVSSSKINPESSNNIHEHRTDCLPSVCTVLKDTKVLGCVGLVQGDPVYKCID